MMISISPKKNELLNLQTSLTSLQNTSNQKDRISLYERCQQISNNVRNFFSSLLSSPSAEELQNVTCLSRYDGEKKCELSSLVDTHKDEGHSPSIGESYRLNLGKVDLIKKIASGSFGHVYIGEYSTISISRPHKVAVKINQIDGSPEMSLGILKSLEFEADLLHRLNLLDPEDSQHIVRYVDFGSININYVCLALEHSDMNLKEFIEKNQPGGISLNRTAEIMKQIFQALNFLHTLQTPVIHNDLKPANILVSLAPDAKIKIADFGVATIGHQMNPNKDYACSRWYRSPEIVLGCSYGTPSDMWSAASIAFEIHTGLPLYPAANQKNLLAMQYQLLGLISEDFYHMVHPDCKGMFSKSLSFSEVYVLDPKLIPEHGPMNRWEFFNEQLKIKFSQHSTINSLDGIHTKENYIHFRSMMFGVFKWFPARRSSACKALNCRFIKSLTDKSSAVSTAAQCTVSDAFA
jgi:serine/threonine protein kinase